MKHLALPVWLAAGIIATTAGADAQLVGPNSSLSLRAAMEGAGRQVFIDHCAACHTPKRDTRVLLAPSLQGIIGRPAASVAGFPYSDAMKNWGLVWTEDNLRKFIADSTHTVPETLMPHASISDPAEQTYLIAYLRTLKPSGAPAR